MSERDWNAELSALWPHRAKWIEPHGDEDDEDQRKWSIELQHESGFETTILSFEDADYEDDCHHRARSMHPRLATLVDDRVGGSTR